MQMPHTDHALLGKPFTAPIAKPQHSWYFHATSLKYCNRPCLLPLLESSAYCDGSC